MMNEKKKTNKGRFEPRTVSEEKRILKSTKYLMHKTN